MVWSTYLRILWRDVAGVPGADSDVALFGELLVAVDSVADYCLDLAALFGIEIGDVQAVFDDVARSKHRRDWCCVVLGVAVFVTGQRWYEAESPVADDEVAQKFGG